MPTFSFNFNAIKLIQQSYKELGRIVDFSLEGGGGAPLRNEPRAACGLVAALSGFCQPWKWSPPRSWLPIVETTGCPQATNLHIATRLLIKGYIFCVQFERKNNKIPLKKDKHRKSKSISVAFTF